MAGASKRMSAEEKRQTILAIYHKSKEVYTEKEIISLASKAGVNVNTIADINQNLVDDNLVDKEKIGGSNYFWSFPAKKDRQNQLAHEETLKIIERLQSQIADSQAKLADAKRGREDDESGERAKKMARRAELKAAKKAAEEELEKLKQNDPQAIADLEAELKFVKEAANRWTDNIFACQDYLVKKRGMPKKEAFKILGINGDFDYPEDKLGE
ncbi:hypothetical protein ACHAXS_008731 [Conticribra weissflogii]